MQREMLAGVYNAFGYLSGRWQRLSSYRWMEGVSKEINHKSATTSTFSSSSIMKEARFNTRRGATCHKIPSEEQASCLCHPDLWRMQQILQNSRRVRQMGSRTIQRLEDKVHPDFFHNFLKLVWIANNAFSFFVHKYYFIPICKYCR